MARAFVLAVVEFAAGLAAAVCPAVVVLTQGGPNMKRSLTLSCGVVLACSVVFLASLSALADDKKDKPALSGTWALKGGEAKIEFADKNVVKFAPHGDSKVIAVICEYTVDKE